MKACSVADCDHSPGYQSAGDEVEDYCECHFFLDVPESECAGRPASPGSATSDPNAEGI